METGVIEKPVEQVAPALKVAEPTQLPSLLRKLLRQRGLTENGLIDAYLRPDYATGLADPFLMTDMEPAVQRILLAAQRGEKVAVYGDYDIDGIASTTLMLEVLGLHGLNPISYIPDRYDEGYGIHIKALESLKAAGVDLVVSVDCGITSVVEAEWAKANGLDLVITDHHEALEELPQAVAVINPRRPGDRYPFKELAGVGVAFGLARALQQKSGIPAAGQEKWLLDLVALGTVCDVMPLILENRTLVHFGLKVLQKTRRVGLVALAQNADLDLADIRAYHLGFRFGPRLNAAGRLEHANFSLELLTTEDPVNAQAHAFQLEELNHQRRLAQERIMSEAEALAETFGSDPTLVIADPGWPHGVVGIVASKLVEKYRKPTLILQILGENAKGSGRSAGGYNLIEGLRAHEYLFTRLGGHHFAAGFTLPTELVDTLRDSLNAHYRSVQEGLPPKQALEADISVDEPAELNWELLECLEMLEPCGNANHQPTFGLSNIKVVSAEHIGKSKQHLKLKLAAGDGRLFEAIGFNLVEKYPDLKNGQVGSIICYVQKNVWNERVSMQLNVLSITK